MKQLRILFYSLLFIFICRATFYSCSDGFSLKRIQFPEIAFTESSIPEKNEQTELQKIFEQPFHYLAKGSQAYAFISRDGKFILKLFKCHHWSDGQWLESFANRAPLPLTTKNWFHTLVERRRTKVENTRLSFDIVKTSLKDECGVLYIQDTPSSSYPLTITIVDKAGRTYQLDASKIAFAVQEKATLIFPTLSEFARTGQVEKIKESIDSLIALMHRRCQKGISDSDPDIHKNAGLIGTTAIHIDIGSFHRKESHKNRATYLFDIEKCVRPLLPWIIEHAPSLESYYQEALKHPENCKWKEY